MSYTLFQGLTANRLADIGRYFVKSQNTYGQMLTSGIFPIVNGFTGNYTFQKDEDSFTLIEANSFGAPASQAASLTGKIYSFALNTYERSKRIWAKDLDGIARLDMDQVLLQENDLLMSAIDIMNKAHDTTLEMSLMFALQGKLLSASGVELLDYYSEFGETRQTYDWDLANPATEITEKMDTLLRYIKDNLNGETMTGVDIYGTRQFMSKLKVAKSLKDRYSGSEFAVKALNAPTVMGTPFILPDYPFVRFFEYFGVGPAVMKDGTTKTIDFLPEPQGYDGQAIAIPTGTSNVFSIRKGPAVRMSTVNKVDGQDYLLTVRDTEDRFLKVITERRWLPMIHKPALVVTLYG